MKPIKENTPGQRIADLCKDYGISQKDLSEKIGLSAPQLSRIISGKTPTISNDALIGIAETFKVSTDYILGLSSVSIPKNYDISQLGLSEKAVKGLVTETIDAEILNRLLENPNFEDKLSRSPIMLRKPEVSIYAPSADEASPAFVVIQTTNTACFPAVSNPVA